MALLVRQLVTRFATIYRPALASGRFLSIKGVRDCDIRGLTTKVSFYAGRFCNISGVRDCDRGFGFNGFHDVRGFATKIYIPSDTKSFYGKLMNKCSTTRHLSRLFKVAHNALDLKNTHVVFPYPLEEEDCECIKVIIDICKPLPDEVSISFDRNTVWVQAFRGKETFVSWYELPDIDSTEKIFKASDIKAVANVELGYIKLIIPKLKTEEMKYDVDIKASSKDD